MNLMSGQLFEELTRHCQKLSTHDNLRAVVLTGASLGGYSSKPAFVGGAELGEVNDLSSPKEAETYIRKCHDACAAVKGLPVPTIARVHGLAIGAGVQLMASCDLRIATRPSRFGMPEAKVGLPSAIQTAFLPGLIGWGRTRRLLYLAEILSADQAETWGLVEKVVSDEVELDRAVYEWVGKIVDMPPQNMRRQKQLVTTWEQSTVQDGILAGIETMKNTFMNGGIEAKSEMHRFLHKPKK
jgi:enoyl-CoA hydratase/carnithine racemase